MKPKRDEPAAMAISGAPKGVQSGEGLALRGPQLAVALAAAVLAGFALARVNRLALAAAGAARIFSRWRRMPDRPINEISPHHLDRRFGDQDRDIVEEGSWESFPASDPPSWMSTSLTKSAPGNKEKEGSG